VNEALYQLSHASAQTFIKLYNFTLFSYPFLDLTILLKPVNIFTCVRNMKFFDPPTALSYDDVLLVPRYSKINSRSEVDTSSQITPRVRLRVPLISINMTDVTGVEMAIAMAKYGGIGFLHRFISPEKQANMVKSVKKHGLMVGAAIGIKDGEMERAEYLVKAGVDILTIDVAHGHMQKTLDITRDIKTKFGNKIDLISGVVATYEGAADLYKAGADSVRVGVGPGTICITRVVAGVGVPQISAIVDAVRAAREYKKTILCDGGTKTTGDIVKGLAAGASGVVIGSQFAGTDEAPGKLVTNNGFTYKEYNASTSYAEKSAHIKKLKELSKDYISHIEGVESIVRHKGPVEKILMTMEANLRAGFSYTGARNIEALWKNAMFIRVTPMGVKENKSHGVKVVKSK
jgi:IMP dehydrogenase